MLPVRAALLWCCGVCLCATICFADVSPAQPSVMENQNRTSAGRLENGVLTLHLELRRALWRPYGPDSRTIEADTIGEEGRAPQAPAPLIRVPQGTEIRASVHNLLSEKAYIHGLHQHPGKADDVVELAPGATREFHFAAGEPGSYVYWASTEKAPVPLGIMSGALIVDPPGTTVADRVFVVQLWDRNLYTSKFEGILAVNGRSWPYTERLQAQLGSAEHWRIVNGSPIEHPMHLHGFYFRIDGVGDGESEHRYSEAERRMAVTELVPPAHSFDMTWVPERAGSWIFHCHILDHMMKTPMAPWLWGPDGPPPTMASVHDEDPMGMGMGALVLGIKVTDPKPHLVPATTTSAVAQRDLYVRERKPRGYTPAGPGFYLQGVSKEPEAAGPPLVITRGERTAITIHNEINEPTAIHWHGIEIESYYDGVPGWSGTGQHTTPYIPAGGSFTAYLTPPRAGTFIYHTRWRDTSQLTSGLYGALLVLEPGKTYDPATDKVFVLGRGGVNEMKDPLLLNGSPQPGLLVLLSGRKYRLRFVNITPNDAHINISLLADGKPVKWRAVAKDGADLPPQQATSRDAMQTISVGETYDFEFSAENPADYLLRFCSEGLSEMTQSVAVVPAGSPFSVFAAKR